MRDLGVGEGKSSLLQDVKLMRQKRIEISRVIKRGFNLYLYTINHPASSSRKDSFKNRSLFFAIAQNLVDFEQLITEGTIVQVYLEFLPR